MLAVAGATQILALLGIGVLAGVAGGLFGVGGGIIMIPALELLFADAYGPDSFHAYNLASITTAMVLSIPASVRQFRARAVVRSILPALTPAALVGVFGGVALGMVLVGDLTPWLKRVFGGFLELVVAISVFQEWRARQGEPHLFHTCPTRRRGTWIALVAGAPAGVIAGLLGVGGGIWAVPAMTLVLGVRLRNAIATSTVLIVYVAAVTSATMSAALARVPAEVSLVGKAWWIALWLAPGALLGGWLGAGWMHRLPVRWLRYAFLVLLAVTGVRLMGR